MNKLKKVLFLYTELSDYFLNCLIKASKFGFEIHIVIYPLNEEAPFNFKKNESIYFYNRKEFKHVKDFKLLINQIEPKTIFVSGWIDKQYLKAIKKSTSCSKKVLMIDTQWSGLFKQKIWAVFFNRFLKKYFNSIWIPGKPQELYAQKLGFNLQDIFIGLYTCNEEVFNQKSFKIDTNKRTKRLLYVGRYSHDKGVSELWDNFIKLNSNLDTKLELWCLGTGKLWDNRILNDYIRHFGFVQPHLIPYIASKCDFYVMPSKYEPWGVSLHEMISLGKPVLVSEDVGSSYCFAKDNINGFVFSHNKKDDFVNKMRNVMKLTEIEIRNMGKESVNLSQLFSTTKWIENLNKIYD